MPSARVLHRSCTRASHGAVTRAKARRGGISGMVGLRQVGAFLLKSKFVRTCLDHRRCRADAGWGIGWLHRGYGLACDHLRSVEIVTADGQLQRASEAENPDLFWAVRGGGGNFGVVTTFEFTAHPLGPVVPVAAVMYPVDNAGELFRAWRARASSAPDEAMSRAIFWWMPEDPLLPPAVHNQQVFIVGAIYTGPPEKGQQVLQPLRELGTPLLDLGAEMPFRMFQAAFDAFFPRGQLASYWKSVYLNELTDDLIDLIVRRATQRPSPRTLVHVPMLGGAMSRVAADATAFGARSAPFMLSVDGNWIDPADTAGNVARLRDVISQVGGSPSPAGPT